MLDIALQPHSTSPEPAVQSLRLSFHRERSGLLSLDYRLAGQLAAVRFAPFTHLRREDRLWEHTCFELFVRQPRAAEYREVNVATSGAWAAYAFTGYRAVMRDIAAFAPDIVVKQNVHELRVQVAIDLRELAPEFANIALELAPAAVIENVNGQRSYWAAHHAASKPDFHHADAFVLSLQY